LPAGGTLPAVLLAICIPTRASNADRTSSLKETIIWLDLQGCALFATTVVMFLLALEWGGQTYPWKSVKIIGLLMAFLVIYVFS
jgi:hypothetical protein